MVRTIPLLAALAVTSASGVSLGQTTIPTGPTNPSPADRQAARNFAIQGIAADQRSDWSTSLERFVQAEQLFHAPIHLRFIARALEHTAPPRLVECAEVWRRLTQEPLAADAPAPFRDAVAEARRELPRIEAQIGSVRVEGSADRVELDGQPLAGAPGAPHWVMPGAHRVTAHRAGAPDFEQTVNVAAGAQQSVAVAFGGATVAVVTNPVNTPPPVDNGNVGLTTPPPSDGTQGPMTRIIYHPSPVRTAGFVVAGIGVAAAIGGVITGVMANGSYSDLEAACPQRVCASQTDLDRASSVNTLAGLTNALLIGGGVLTAAGVVMIVVGKPRAETVQVSTAGAGLRLTVHF